MWSSVRVYFSINFSIICSIKVTTYATITTSSPKAAFRWYACMKSIISLGSCLWQFIQNSYDSFSFKTNRLHGIQQMRGQVVLMHWPGPINQSSHTQHCYNLTNINPYKKNTQYIKERKYSIHKIWYLQTSSAIAMRCLESLYQDQWRTTKYSSYFFTSV